jgi:hypothetical protein
MTFVFLKNDPDGKETTYQKFSKDLKDCIVQHIGRMYDNRQPLSMHYSPVKVIPRLITPIHNTAKGNGFFYSTSSFV